MVTLILEKEKDNSRTLRRMLFAAHQEESQVLTAYSESKVTSIEEKIDLVICDIAFLREPDAPWKEILRKKNPLMQLVVSGPALSGQDIRRAMQCGATDYLPRPYQQDVLRSVLDRCGQEQVVRRNVQQFIQSGKYWRQNQIYVHELFWKKLCLNRFPANPDEIEEAAFRVDIALDKDAYFKIMVLTMKNQSEMWNSMGEGACQAALQKLTRMTLFEDPDFARVIVIYSRIVVVLEQQEFESAESRCRRLVQRCGQELGAELICYIGTPVFCEGIAEAYSQLLAYSKDDVLKQNGVVYVDKRKRGENKIVLPAAWGDLLYSNQPLALVTSVRSFLTPLAQSGQLTEQNFRIFQQDLLQLFFSYMERKALRAHELYDNDEIYKLYKVAILSIDGMCLWVRKCVEYITKGMCDENASENKKVISGIKKFIHLNLSEAISLPEIAEAVHLSPDYATKIFKKETGITIKEYLIQERMEQAKKMLLAQNATVSEIALEVGYSNLSYFIRAFRSYFHITPKQFQKQKD